MTATAIFAFLPGPQVVMRGISAKIVTSKPIKSGGKSNEQRPLWQLENVIVSSHLAGFFAEYEEYTMPILVENMRLFLDGKTGEMRNIVAH